MRRLTVDERLGAKGGSMNGSHRPEGVLIMAGPDVERGICIDGAQIVDVAPTLLRLLGVESPAELDGHPLIAALLPAPERRAQVLSERDVEPSPYSVGESATVRKRLRGLGYRE